MDAQWREGYCGLNIVDGVSLKSCYCPSGDVLALAWPESQGIDLGGLGFKATKQWSLAGDLNDIWPDKS
jgi:hypothetical protein